MKIMKATLSLFCLFLWLTAASQDVRSVSWGMSKEKVKSLEGAQKWETSKGNAGAEIIFYEGSVGGLKAYIAFYFYSNRLCQITYVFTETHSSKILYKDDFYKIAAILDKKYGASGVEMVWKEDLYKDDPKEWGMALAVGHLTMYSIYENEKTEVDHTIKGDNYNISHTIVFLSKEFAELAESMQKDQTKDF